MTEKLQNAIASLEVDLEGGAITSFEMIDQGINPLEFSFSEEQMPENNRAGAPYKGHFICLGRWGSPSAGEIQKGVPHHGQFANMVWKTESRHSLELQMSASSELEGLAVQREIQMHPHSPVVAVKETVENIQTLDRLYNLVQHPTVTWPFLEAGTLVDCNAGRGFSQDHYQCPQDFGTSWPVGYGKGGQSIDLRSPSEESNGIYSYVIDSAEPLGWITCYSPGSRTLIGYVWSRNDYPWIHLWMSWDHGRLRYRGLDFGTAGIHQPFRKLLQQPEIFGQSTFRYLEAGSKKTYRYQAFLLQTPYQFEGVNSLNIREGRICIVPKGNLDEIRLPSLVE